MTTEFPPSVSRARRLAAAVLRDLGAVIDVQGLDAWHEAARTVSKNAASGHQPTNGVCLTTVLGELRALIHAGEQAQKAAVADAAAGDELMRFLAAKEPVVAATMPDYLPVLRAILAR